ncbi:MAG: hypothetical protein IE926_08640 [Micrococcales bacterium]|nr:hypothetical protein [Micrococcales bacterium]
MTAVVGRPISVAELQRAWHATLAGTYRPGGGQRSGPVWEPDRRALPVVGACAGAGASTLTLALATASGDASLVECASATASGLSAAATAELGQDANGWIRGTRGAVTLTRPGQVLSGPGEVPVPALGQGPGLVVLDVAWDLGAVLTGNGWLATVLHGPGPVVVVARASVPGVRRLDAALHLLAHAGPVLALVGTRRPPRPVAAAVAEVTARHHLTGNRIVHVPLDARLAARGIDSAPLPTSLLSAAGSILRTTELHERTTR